MDVRVVCKSSFTFETDLPPSSHNIHPSGVLHAFRSTPTTSLSNGRDEHTFAWITDSLYIEPALTHLEKHGFEEIVFIPYSTKRNWVDRYPHAAPSLECTGDGKVAVYLNWRPYPNGLGEMGIPKTLGEQKRVEKRKNEGNHINMGGKKTFLPDAERDELHIEIYNYFSWLAFKLGGFEKSNAAAKATIPSATENPPDTEIENDNKAATGMRTAGGWFKTVDVYELRRVLDRMELAFLVIQNVKLEEEEQDIQHKQASQQLLQPKLVTAPEVPFLEDALDKELSQLVAARRLRGQKRRSRQMLRESKRKRIASLDSVQQDRTRGDFDTLFQRLVQYKEEHGDCFTPAQSDALSGLATKCDMFENTNATLSPRPKTLHDLWMEYQFGLSGRKPAKDFTEAERGKCKSVYSFRLKFWEKCDEMVRSGIYANVACDRLYQAYGVHNSVTKILHAMKKDKKQGTWPASLQARESKRKWTASLDSAQDRTCGDFDKLFQQLVQYKEEHDDCFTPAQSDALSGLVTKSHMLEHPDATLSARPKTLHDLWKEYQFGLDGRKPAKDFTKFERGKCKSAYSFRLKFWEKCDEMVRSGIEANVACDKLHQAYGVHTSVTKILHAMRKDKMQGTWPASLQAVNLD